VATELKTLADLFKTFPCLNERFTRPALNEAILEKPTWLHLASHAIFEGDESKSYIQLWQSKLTLKDLKDLDLKGISLLTLSACETAKGDEKAGLGLSGVAESSGVMTVLGSLWSVNDASTEKLMELFYKNLGDANQVSGKAIALQKAQLALLLGTGNANGQPDRSGSIIPLSSSKSTKTTGTFSDPFYWAPFILIGNWQ
jgi:CHAT domain-containing protein